MDDTFSLLDRVILCEDVFGVVVGNLYKRDVFYHVVSRIANKAFVLDAIRAPAGVGVRGGTVYFWKFGLKKKMVLVSYMRLKFRGDEYEIFCSDSCGHLDGGYAVWCVR